MDAALSPGTLNGEGGLTMAKKNALQRQSNKVSESRRDWTILMARAYCRVVEIFNQRVDAWVQHNNMPSEFKYSDLFPEIPLQDLLVYDIPRTDLAVTGKDGKVDVPTVIQFKQAFDRLADKALVYGSPDDEEDWLRINILGSVKYDKATDCVHIKQHEDIVNHLLGQRDKYTGFNPWMSFKFVKSKYSFTFYQWCCQWRRKGTFEMSIKEIKWKFELDEHRDSSGKLHKEQYKEPRYLIKRVIEPAREELQELFDAGDSDICFEYEPTYDKSKPGRPVVTGFHFTVVKKENTLLPPPSPQPLEPSLFDDANSRLKAMRETLLYYWSRSHDKQWPVRAIQELGLQVVADEKLLDKVELYIKDTIHDAYKGKVQNVPGAIHEYFKKQLGIVVDKKTTAKGGQKRY